MAEVPGITVGMSKNPRDDMPATTAEEAMARHELIPDELLDESGYDHPEAGRPAPKSHISIEDPEGQRHVARANEALDN